MTSTASSLAARLREIADAVEQLEIPESTFPSVSVSFEEVQNGDAHALASALAAAYHDTNREMADGRVSAAWYGNRDAAPVRFTLWYPEAPNEIRCEECGGVDPRETFDELRLETAGVR